MVASADSGRVAKMGGGGAMATRRVCCIACDRRPADILKWPDESVQQIVEPLIARIASGLAAQTVLGK
jgi:hypothetical protein